MVLCLWLLQAAQCTYGISSPDGVQAVGDQLTGCAAPGPQDVSPQVPHPPQPGHQDLHLPLQGQAHRLSLTEGNVTKITLTLTPPPPQGQACHDLSHTEGNVTMIPPPPTRSSSSFTYKG